jgi:membrane associated rhomboid family serine protease/Tfp pilus assembly protein PilF
MADQYPAFPAPVPQPQEAASRTFRPIATWTLIALNFLVFGLEIQLGGFENNSVLLNLGAAYGPYLQRGDYWRLVMPIFLHAGWSHIFGNTIVLFILGRIMERLYGYGRYLTIYVASGMGGAFLTMTLSKNISVGASGAILGIAGGLFAAGFLYGDTMSQRWRRALGWRLLPFIGVVLISGLADKTIDNWGHVGGLMTGALMARIIPPPRREENQGELVEAPSQILVVLPLAIVILAGVATARHFRVLQTLDRLLTESQQLEDAHQFDRELQVIQEALRLAPKEEQPHELLGEFYLAQKKFDPAISEFQKALKLSGGDDHAQLELGLAYELKGDSATAQQIFGNVLEADPQTEQGKELLASKQAELGDLYLRQKRYSEAITLYNHALALDADLAEAQNNLAWLYATCEDEQYRDPEGAMEHAERAVELTQSKDPNSLDTLAEANYVNGKFEKAVEIERKALSLDPSNQELKDHMVKYRRGAAI